MHRTADPETPNELARFEAQKLAFAPLLFQGARAMRDLGVLGALYKAGPRGLTVDEVSRETSLGRYAAGVLLEAGIATGLARVTGSPLRFAITKAGVYFVSDRLTRVNTEFSHHVCYRAAEHLAESLREGLPAGLRELGPFATVYEGLHALPPDVKRAWFDFDHHYSDSVFSEALAQMVAEKVRHIVDLGGNTGRFARAFLAAAGPDAKVTIVDLPAQVAMAKESLADLGDRVAFHPTDVRGPGLTLPRGDAYWMSQFLDCFPEGEIAHILGAVRRAIPPEGRAFVLETFWDRQRYEAARTCVIATTLYFACVANGSSRMLHSDDMERLVVGAGLRVASARHDLGLAHSLLTCVPA
jgi:hypothetical protein